MNWVAVKPFLVAIAIWLLSDQLAARPSLDVDPLTVPIVVEGSALTSLDFRIRDNRNLVSDVSINSQPFDIQIVLSRSPGFRSRFAEMEHATLELHQALGDTAKLAVSSTTVPSTVWSSDRRTTADILTQLRYEAANLLWTPVDRSFRNASPSKRRRAIIICASPEDSFRAVTRKSDAADDFGPDRWLDNFDAAARHWYDDLQPVREPVATLSSRMIETGVPIYLLTLVSDSRLSDQDFLKLAATSGGAVMPAHEVGSVLVAMKRAVQQLRSTYFLVIPRIADGNEHEVEIALTASPDVVRAKRTYRIRP